MTNKGDAKRISPLRIQQSFPVPRPTTNPYIVMLANELGSTDGVSLRTFRWRSAIFGRYDVFHAHWPEILVAGATPAKAAARQLLTALLLVRLALTKAAVVRTLHNLALPEGISSRERWLLRRFERRTTLWIGLNSDTPFRPDQPHEIILHGHYRDWFARFDTLPTVPGRFGYFGLIRRYKNVEGLLDAFREVSGPYSLVISGRPSSDALREALVASAARDPRVELNLRFIEEAEVAQRVTESELVVLPYKHMHNSGGVLAALSLGRPVLVPDNSPNRSLGAEVGLAWVQTYQGDLSGHDLERALKAVRTALTAGERPDLSRREWTLAGEQHVGAYRRAVQLRRQSGTRRYS